MNILAIDTSCDETSAAVTCQRRILANELYSQIHIHAKWGGVVPNLARRAHEEHIEEVVARALRRARMTMEDIDAIAVTFGPGLAIALGVGITHARAYALTYAKPLIAVNHMEGHIYSCFAQNGKGNPAFDFAFPYLALLVSGKHTELVLFRDHGVYEVLGCTLDDAAGEALDKAARLIVDDAVYPGGQVLERLALTGDAHAFVFPRPMIHSGTLDFSYSGIKTALKNTVKDMPHKERVARMSDLSAAFQYAVFDSLLFKLAKAVEMYSVRSILIGGGVSANRLFRSMIRRYVRSIGGTVLMPSSAKLHGDNAAMIGIAAYYKAQAGCYVDDAVLLERQARVKLESWK